MSQSRADRSAAVGIIACGGALPFAVADALRARGIDPVLFAIQGICDPAPLPNYRHHFVAPGKFGRLNRLLHSENCRDVVLVGSLVRPSLKDLRFDWGAVRMIPRIAAALKGGDDHLLTRVAEIFEREGFNLVGISEIAPIIV